MSDGAFYGYILLLIVSGILLAAVAVGGRGQSVFSRVVSALFAVGYLGYAFYLLFIFDGGEVTISFYAFIVPVLMLIQVYRSRRASRELHRRYAAAQRNVQFPDQRQYPPYQP